jgi:hypothetical protein
MLIKNFIIPEPVKYDLVHVNYGEDIVSYTDCFEISLLRFLHLIFGKNNKINLKLLQKHMNKSKYCKNLLNFFSIYNNFSEETSYYFTDKGFEERAMWCKFLNDSKIFKYKKEDNYEVCATFENLFTFFKIYFPNNNFETDNIIKITVGNIKSHELFKYYENKLNKLFQNLSYNFDLSCKLNFSFQKYKRTRIDYKPIYTQIIMQIYIDSNYVLDWEIYQFHNIINGKIKERITGHSDYRLNKV